MSIPAQATRKELRASAGIVRAPAADAAGALVLDDGRRIRFRRIVPEDREGLAALFARLSTDSRQRRFMGPRPTLSRRELDYFTDVDHVNHEAIVAVDQRHGSIVGEARYVRYRDRPGIADLAVTVIDDLHRKGIGTALGERVVARATENRVQRLTALTSWENRPARALLKRLGFRPRSSAGHEIEFELALDAEHELSLG